jgi:hypothetical protein
LTDDELARIDLAYVDAGGNEVNVYCPQSRNAPATLEPLRRCLNEASADVVLDVRLNRHLHDRDSLDFYQKPDSRHVIGDAGPRGSVARAPDGPQIDPHEKAGARPADRSHACA